MIRNCPHCHTPLRLSDSQQAQLKKALAALAPGKQITIRCPNCKKAIRLGRNGPAETPAAATKAGGVRPPAPPDLDWLKTGRFQGEEKVEDVPMALVLFADSPAREKIREAMESVGYQVMTVETADEAMERMRFVNFACVVFHSSMEGSLDNSAFHRYMRQMAMERRRYIFYILIGPEFHTLYDLEALATSANLVVAEGDLQYFDIILRKAIPAYEELFGPILEELGAQGKR